MATVAAHANADTHTLLTTSCSPHAHNTCPSLLPPSFYPILLTPRWWARRHFIITTSSRSISSLGPPTLLITRSCEPGLCITMGEHEIHGGESYQDADIEDGARLNVRTENWAGKVTTRHEQRARQRPSPTSPSLPYHYPCPYAL